MATYPKYPPEPRPGPQPVPVYQVRGERRFKLILGAVAAVIAVAVVLIAIWLLKYGGGAPGEQPKPHQTNNGTPAGVFLIPAPRL